MVNKKLRETKDRRMEKRKTRGKTENIVFPFYLHISSDIDIKILVEIQKKKGRKKTTTDRREKRK
jgi:hypothetical protein